MVLQKIDDISKDPDILYRYLYASMNAKILNIIPTEYSNNEVLMRNRDLVTMTPSSSPDTLSYWAEQASMLLPLIREKISSMI